MADNMKQKEKLVCDLDEQIAMILEGLTSMKKSIDEIQNGNGKHPYWNGSNAYSVLKTALTQYETNLDLIGKIQECQEKIKN